MSMFVIRPTASALLKQLTDMCNVPVSKFCLLPSEAVVIHSRLTTVLQHWLVYRVHCCSACSLCWMPLLDWCSLQVGQNTSRHFSVNYTGWKFRREYSFVCVFWRIVASMALRHRTLLRHFSRRLMYEDVVVSGLLRRRHSSYHRHAELPLVIVRFRLLRRVPGIPFQLRWGKSSHCLRSAGNWRQHCLPSLFRQTDRDII